MDWYYAVGQERKGPIDDQEFQRLVREGAIHADTLVWNRDMADWAPYSTVAGLQAPPVAAPSGQSPLSQPHTSEDVWGSAMEYAGFWLRFGAVFLDGLILFGVNTVVGLIAGVGVQQRSPFEPVPPEELAVHLALFGVQMLIAIVYETVMVGRFGATLGKMACRIRVVRADGNDVSYLLAFGRYWGKQVSGIICGVGYIMAAFDQEKRALHDHMCSTRVVRIG